MSERLARPLHPAAWWLWALGLAAASTRTTNVLTLLMFAGVAFCVVSFRRSDAPWAQGFGLYLRLGLVIIAIRVIFRVLLGTSTGGTILFTLPEVQLPEAAAGIRLGGPVELEGVLAAVYEGVRLATLLLCLGAANMLADPKRLLKSLPAALHELGVAVTVALMVAPQLVASSQRIRKARRLRGTEQRVRGVITGILLPVLEDALDRSLVLASAMDSRGYGRTADQPPGVRRVTSILVLAGVAGVCIGTYGVLDATTPRALGAPMLLAGCLLAIGGIKLAGRRVRRTVYRPDPWQLPEWLVVACGFGAAAIMFAAASIDPDNLYPSLQPLRWPTLGILPVLAGALALLPAWLAPPVPASTTRSIWPTEDAPPSSVGEPPRHPSNRLPTRTGAIR